MSRWTLLALSVLVLSFAAFAQSNPVPFVNQPLVPSAVAPGGAKFTLTVNGTGFVAGSIVRWNDSDRVTQFVSSEKLLATIKATDIGAPATGAVTVFNPAPGGGISNAVYFEVSDSRASVSFKLATASIPNLSDSAAVADLNHDGKLDLVEINGSSAGVSVYLGNGDGTFQSPAFYSCGEGPARVTVADFNHDGNLDLIVAVTSEQREDFSLLLGNGDGTFQSARGWGIRSLGSGTLLVADFDGDGNLDVLAADLISYLFYRGNGDGTFRLPLGVVAGSPSMVTGDFDGDGKLDIAGVETQSPYDVLIWKGNGDGTFQPSYSVNAAGAGSVLTADVNGDSKLDLIVTNAATVSVILGDGKGGFGAPTSYGTGAQPLAVWTADFNSDGKLDLSVFFNSSPRQVSFLLGNGDGTFQTQVDVPLPQSSTNIQVLGDFNGDGMVDLIGGDYSNAVQTLFLQTTLLVSPTALSFPTTLVGTQSATQDVTLTNIGSLTIDFKSFAFSGAATRDYLGAGDCGRNILPGGSCTVSVSFAPKKPGMRMASLDITDSTSAIPSQAALTGHGTALLIDPTSLDFGDQPINTTSAPMHISLTNIGKGVARITMNLIGQNRRDFSETGCPGALGPGQSCTLDVTFSPRVRGQRSATLRITGGGPSQGVTLSGVGI